MRELWNSTYSDQLKAAILSIKSPMQRSYFLRVFNRMGNYIFQHEDQEFITFGEYFDLFERDFLYDEDEELD